MLVLFELGILNSRRKLIKRSFLPDVTVERKKKVYSRRGLKYGNCTPIFAFVRSSDLNPFTSAVMIPTTILQFEIPFTVTLKIGHDTWTFNLKDASFEVDGGGQWVLSGCDLNQGVPQLQEVLVSILRRINMVLIFIVPFLLNSVEIGV